MATDGSLMARQFPNGVKIDQTHASAICEEIGERLRASPAGKPTRTPAHIVRLAELLRLMERFESAERDISAFPEAAESTPR